MLRRTIIVSLASVVALVASGCNTSSSEGPVASSHDVHAGHDEPAGDDAAHPNQGPHGGHLIELGDEQYHAELLHDEAAHCITIHLLDSAGSQPITTGPNEMRLQVLREGQFVDYLFPAVNDSAEPTGSHFQLIDEDLTDFLLHAAEVRARLHATINGQEYTGAIEHTAHDHDAHAVHDDDSEHAEADRVQP